MEALALKYRPREFEDVVSQVSVVKVLERQLEVSAFKNCYLFCGPSGTGKTTLARIFARKINKEEGTPIEIDAASNNGVDNIRELIANAKERALDCEYKVIILDEAHMLTTQSWNALLKILEEPPKYTIFMFCTTDPQKIPATIINRVQKFNLTKIDINSIKNRLEYICKKENFTNYSETVDYISKLANGGMRDAIALLDKASSVSTDLSLQNVIDIIGNYSYDTMFDVINGFIDGDVAKVLGIVEDLYNRGNDLKLFEEQLISFTLDLFKYCIFKSFDCIQIPRMFEDKLIFTIKIDNNTDYFNYILKELLEVKNQSRYDVNFKNTLEVTFIKLSRGE